MSALPEPLVPPDADCRQFDGFLLNSERLLASELWALSTGDELKAALALWCRAWKQVPAGSLPDDDRVLASFSGAGRRWAKARDMALRGFVKCSDGRFYHPVLCEDVARAMDRQQQYRDRRDKDAERLRKWREKHDGNVTETRFETRSTVQGQEGTVPKDIKITPNPAERGFDELKSEKVKPRAAGTNPRAAGTNPRAIAANYVQESPWPQRCRSWARGHRWDPMHGPAPDEPGCQAPPELIEQAITQRRALSAA